MGNQSLPTDCHAVLHILTPPFWAAWYITRLLAQSTPKGAVFSCLAMQDARISGSDTASYPRLQLTLFGQNPHAQMTEQTHGMSVAGHSSRGFTVSWHECGRSKLQTHSVMDVLDLPEGHRVSRGHGSGVLQVSDQESQLPGIADGVQLLLVGVPCHVHQAMHEPLQLLHLAALGSGLLLPPHQPAKRAQHGGASNLEGCQY